MWTRVIGVVSVFLFFGAFACGGDDDSSSTFSDTCTMGSKSVPNGMNDPCPQNDPKCPATMYVAVASCGVDLKWQKGMDGAIACACVPKAGGTGGAPAAAMGRCGDGVIQTASGEQCEGAQLMGMTCMSLGMGSGILKCNMQTCRYDTSMCPTMSGVGGHGMGGHGG
jgi:hypothetical protein